MSSKHSKPADDNFYSLVNLLYDKKWDSAFELIINHKEVATMVDQNRNTALHAACYRGAPLQIIDELIRLNPHATQSKNSSGDLPLHLVFYRLCRERADPAVVRRLLEADPAAAKVQNNHGNLPLHCTADDDDIPAESFEILLAAHQEGARVANNDVDLPLHVACRWLLRHGNLCQILSLLMQANPAAVSTPNEDGHYPFHTMLQEIVGTLNPESMRGFNMVLDATSDVARTPCPFYNGGLPLHYLLDNPPTTENFSDLLTECVAILLKAHPGALIFPNNDGQLPLHIVVKKWPFDDEYDEDGELLDNPPPAEELSETHCQLIETLIKANPSAASISDHEGHLALHLACMIWPCNRIDRLTALLAANQNALDHADSHGKTPLQYAFERESDAQEFVTGLISVIQQVERKRFSYTIMANEGLSVGLAGARKGLDEEREKNRLLEEENAELKEEISRLRS